MTEKKNGKKRPTYRKLRKDVATIKKELKPEVKLQMAVQTVQATSGYSKA